MQIITSREFNQRTNEVQKAAKESPVLITNRGEPDLVVMSYQEYEKMVGKSKTLLEVFSDYDPKLLEAIGEIDIDIPERSAYQREKVEFD